ncbi:hypothetical protein ACFQH6_01420 [Halobacteriaceae archaeon GCM10025711]
MPADNVTTTPPEDNVTTTPPEDNVTTTPADNVTTTPPEDNVTTTPPEDNVTENASVTFDDQTSNGSAVVVQSVTLPEGGFVVIHDDSLFAGDAVGSVVGNSEYLEPGTHENVTVTLDESFNESVTLVAMAHLDTNENQVYDFSATNGTDDGPYTVGGEPVIDEAAVGIVAVEEPAPPEDNATTTPPEDNATTTPPEDNATTTPPEEMTANVTFGDQTIDDAAVTVDSATLPEGGFIVIHDVDGMIIGYSDYLEPGSYENVTVNLSGPVDPAVERTKFVAMLHRDTDMDQQLRFEAGSERDGPYLDEDHLPVIDKAHVTFQGSVPAQIAG